MNFTEHPLSQRSLDLIKQYLIAGILPSAIAKELEFSKPYMYILAKRVKPEREKFFAELADEFRKRIKTRQGDERLGGDEKKERDALLVEMATKGLRPKQIAEIAGLSPAYLIGQLSRMGVAKKRTEYAIAQAKQLRKEITETETALDFLKKEKERLRHQTRKKQQKEYDLKTSFEIKML